MARQLQEILGKVSWTGFCLAGRPINEADFCGAPECARLTTSVTSAVRCWKVLRKYFSLLIVILSGRHEKSQLSKYCMNKCLEMELVDFFV